jgi:hypothetical protein
MRAIIRFQIAIASLTAILASLVDAAAPPARQGAVARLVRQLGSDDFDEREAASRGLEALGRAALPALHRAVRSPDLEVRRRARDLRRRFFFNGKDLDGWEGLKEYWSVEGGAIVGRSERPPAFNTFLCSKKKYKDFELKFKVRLKNGFGNSGVQFRSTVFDSRHFRVRGPQADIGAGWWGSLIDEGVALMKKAPAQTEKTVVKASEFNAYSIRCVGKHVTLAINGTTTIDAKFPALPDEGVIAFQLHGGYKDMEVTFKDVEFKEIKGEKKE